MTKPPAFITSVRVEQSGGPHEYVSVWIRGQNVGTLCVGKGDGEPLAAILNGEAPAEAAPVWAESWRDERPFHVAPEDTPTLMDPTPHEITPWMRGALEAMRVSRPIEDIRDSDPSWTDPEPWPDHTKAEAEPGAPAPSPPAANEEPGLESRPPGVPSAAGAPDSISPDDPRVLAQRRIRDGLEASLRADEQKRRVRVRPEREGDLDEEETTG